MEKAISIISCSSHHDHGTVFMEETYKNGPVKFTLDIKNLPPGLHGFHVHRSGNTLNHSTSLCDHFNPDGNNHGDLNERNAHAGDLGNILVDDNRECKTSFIANYVTIRGKNSILGRSLVIHEDQDDLGRGNFKDSKITGHSGERIAYGIIALDEECH